MIERVFVRDLQVCYEHCSFRTRVVGVRFDAW